MSQTDELRRAIDKNHGVISRSKDPEVVKQAENDNKRLEKELEKLGYSSEPATAPEADPESE